MKQTRLLPNKSRRQELTDHDEITDACTQYLTYCLTNTIQTERIFHNKGEIIRADVPRVRLASVQGLCVMLGVSMAKWRLMRADKRLPRRIEAIEQAELRIAVFAVEMAGAEAVNAAIAGRILDQLGLAQKQTVETVEHDDNVKRMRNSELQKAAERSNGYRPWTGRS